MHGSHKGGPDFERSPWVHLGLSVLAGLAIWVVFVLPICLAIGGGR